MSKIQSGGCPCEQPPRLRRRKVNMKISENGANQEIQGVALLQRSTYNPRKYRNMCDPPVVTAPFDIELDEDKCIGCGICMRGCPTQVLVMVRREKPSEFQSPACQYNCPAGVDVRTVVRRLAEGGSLEEAWRTIAQNNPFPAVTGRVCPHPCEQGCNRQYFDDEAAVNINCLERGIGDYGIENDLRFSKPEKNMKEKIAVIGAGPSGMSAAYQLAIQGYQVTVFESSAQPGGMLRYAIPSYRLPVSIVEKEIARITEIGVQIKLNTTVGKDVALADLRRQYDAVYISTGAQLPVSVGIKDGCVRDGLEILRLIKEGEKPQVGQRVLVIGGGNTAIDAARLVIRKGSTATVLYRRTRSEMPALSEEVDSAMDEGVKIEFLTAPSAVVTKGNDQYLICKKIKLGEPDASGRPQPVAIEGSDFEVAFDTLIAATGQSVDTAGFEEFCQAGVIDADLNGKTGMEKIYAGGDAVTGPSYVSNAIGAGSRAALAIHNRLRGISPREGKKLEISYQGIPMSGNEHYRQQEHTHRNEKQVLPAEKRIQGLDVEDVLPYSREQMVSESKRCLGCGLYRPIFSTIRDIPYFGKKCLACHDCMPLCPQKALIMPYFLRVDEGHWATANDLPADPRDGYPNPLRLPHPVPLDEIRDQITETEYVALRRRSTRMFKQEALPRTMIERVLESARFAPTAGNCIGMKFVVITKRDLMDRLAEETAKFLIKFPVIYRKKSFLRNLIKRLLVLLYPNSMDIRPMMAITALGQPQFNIDKGPISSFFDAPCAIMIVPHRLHVSHPEVAVGIIAQSMVLTAHSLGLGTCYVGLTTNTLNKNPFAKRKFKKELGLEWPYDHPGMFLLLGYPAVQTDGEVPREYPYVQWIDR